MQDNYTPGPKYEVGTRLGPWEVEGFTNGEYEVRCTRCGWRTRKKSNGFYKNQKRCGECRNKERLFGKLITYDEICEIFGVKKHQILYRMGPKKRLSLEDAIFYDYPSVRDEYRRDHEQITICGKTKTLSEWAEFSGIDVELLLKRGKDLFDKQELINMGLIEPPSKVERELLPYISLRGAHWVEFEFRSNRHAEGDVLVGCDLTGRVINSLKKRGVTPFDDDTPAGVIHTANLLRVLERNERGDTSDDDIKTFWANAVAHSIKTTTRGERTEWASIDRKWFTQISREANKRHVRGPWNYNSPALDMSWVGMIKIPERSDAYELGKFISAAIAITIGRCLFFYAICVGEREDIPRLR